MHIAPNAKCQWVLVLALWLVPLVDKWMGGGWNCDPSLTPAIPEPLFGEFHITGCYTNVCTSFTQQEWARLEFVCWHGFECIFVKFPEDQVAECCELLNCLHVCVCRVPLASGQYWNGTAAVCSARAVVEGQCLSLSKVSNINILLVHTIGSSVYQYAYCNETLCSVAVVE